MKYRKKPVEIDALQLTWDNWQAMCDFAGVGHLDDGKPSGGYSIPGTHEMASEPLTDEHVLALAIPTLEGLMLAHEGDWIIRGVQGELYPCKPAIFAATYEQVDP